MTDIAFLGDRTVKAQALDRLRAHIAAGTFVFFPAWEDGKANMIGALVEADDKQAFADQYGYPIAFVTALEGIINAFQVLPAAQDFVEALLERTPVGADLSGVVSQALVFLLERPDIVALTTPCPEVEHCRRAVVALHRRAIAGEEPDRKEWKSVRLAAVAATDAITDGTFPHLAGMIVEGAAWPATMRSVLHDTLGAFGRLESRQIMEEIGWTEADESRVFKIRHKAEGEQRMVELTGLGRVLGLLDEDDPELARRFRERLEHYKRMGEMYRTVGWTIIDLLEQAPLSVPPGTNMA